MSTPYVPDVDSTNSAQSPMALAYSDAPALRSSLLVMGASYMTAWLGIMSPVFTLRKRYLTLTRESNMDSLNRKYPIHSEIIMSTTLCSLSSPPLLRFEELGVLISGWEGYVLHGSLYGRHNVRYAIGFHHGTCVRRHVGIFHCWIVFKQREIRERMPRGGGGVPRSRNTVRNAGRKRGGGGSHNRKTPETGQ